MENGMHYIPALMVCAKEERVIGFDGARALAEEITRLQTFNAQLQADCECHRIQAVDNGESFKKVSDELQAFKEENAYLLGRIQDLSPETSDGWVLHIIGPDDVIGYRDELTALRQANELNKGLVAAMGEHNPNDPFILGIAKQRGVDDI